MKRSILVIIASALALLILLPFSCSKKENSETSNEPSKGGEGDEELENKQSGTIAISTTDLSTTYPIGLTVTALPQAIDPSPGQPGVGTVLINTTALNLQNNPNPPPQDDSFAKHPKEILVSVQEKLDGKADSCIDPQIFRKLVGNIQPEEICFGSDYGIIAGLAKGLLDGGQVNPAVTNIAEGSRTSATVLSALEGHGQFQKATKEDVCMVVKGREFAGKASRRINAAMELFSGLICTAKKANAKLPGVSESLDITDQLSGFESGANATTVSAATISRKKDQDGRPVYLSEITFKLSQTNNSSGSYKVRLVHSPSSDGNGAYNGVLQMLSDQSEGSVTRDALVSLSYVKSGNDLNTQRIRYEVREGNFVRGTNKSASDPLSYFGSDGRLDLNAVDPDGAAQNANDYLSGMYYLIVDVNPSTYAGSISVWNNPGGNYNESARGFIFETSANADGTLSGCAWAGAYRDTSIRKAIKANLAIKPSGCYTPQILGAECNNPTNPNDNQGPQVWKQCFKQNTSEEYAPDLSNILDKTNVFDVLSAAPSDMPNIVSSDIPGVVAE